MRIVNSLPATPDAVGPLSLDVWKHDWQTWIGAFFDANGNQVGEATYGFRKAHVLAQKLNVGDMI